MATPEEIDVLVSKVDFELALSELVPSVSQGEMDHYREVQKKFASDTINAIKEGEDTDEPELTAAQQPRPDKGKGKARVSLFTYSEIPWHSRWYQKFGFKEVDPTVVGPQHVERMRFDVEERDMNRPGYTRCGNLHSATATTHRGSSGPGRRCSAAGSSRFASRDCFAAQS